MAIYYVDFENGNDAAAGISWATAWKTPQNGPTAARIAPGDEIRYAQTAAPVSIGTATWTSGKVGNSITFASAPTKQIDTCKSGWVTMGAGSTVTNAQVNAYMTPLAFGGTTVGALQVTTAASANGAYKNLGAVTDFSAHQQVSFWFRTSATFDCTGAQNMFVRLCSDTAGTVVVNTLTMPKWSYVANTWYPIVIDSGAALGSNIQSVSTATTNATTQTFYYDEIFASPAGGLTLRSLIGLNDNDWHAIRCVRDADVQLLAGFVAATATGSTSYLGTLDAAWMGTTQTSTTYKLEASTISIPATGPSATTHGLYINEAAQTVLPNKFRGGWDTATGLQTGVTFLEGITQISGGLGATLPNNSYTLIENFGLVRYNSYATNTSQVLWKDTTVVASQGFSQNTQASDAFAVSIINEGYTAWGFKSISGSHNPPTFSVKSYYSAITPTFNIGNVWGCSTNSNGLNIVNMYNINVNIGNYYPSGCINTALSISGSAYSNIKIEDYLMCKTNQLSGNAVSFISLTGHNNNIKIKDVDIVFHSGQPISGTGNVLYIKSLTGTGNNSAFGGFGATSGSNTIYIDSFSATASLITSSVTDVKNTKQYFHNFNGVNGYFRAYVSDGNTATGYFDLQAIDVYTPGSKAVRFNNAIYVAGSTAIGTMFDLKLASAAVVANKLVTVTARVKRNSTNVEAGIYVPAFTMMLPGYTSDIITSCTTTGTYELLTITFTPTADCVFDLNAYFKPLAAVTPDIVWDALSITQAT